MCECKLRTCVLPPFGEVREVVGEAGRRNLACRKKTKGEYILYCTLNITAGAREKNDQDAGAPRHHYLFLLHYSTAR